MSSDMNSGPGGQSLSDLSWDKSLSSSMQQDVADGARSGGQQGDDTLGTIRQGAASIGGEAKDRASRYIEGQKDAVTQHLDDFATAVKRASDELSQRDQTMASHLVRQAAIGLESMSRSVNGASINDVLSSVRAFGRANPVAFLGGAMLAGLAIGRFARASSRREHEMGAGVGQDTGDWRQGGPQSQWQSGRSGNDAGYTGGVGEAGASAYGSGSSGHTTFGPAGTAFSGSGSEAAPPASQGYAGGGMGADPIQSSTPSSANDPSVSASSNAAPAINSGAISTGETS